MIDNEEIYEMVISLGSLNGNEHPLPKSQFHFHFKRNGICATLCISSADAFRGQNFLRYPDTGTGSFLRNPLSFHSATCGKCNCPRSGTQERKRSSDHPDHRGRSDQVLEICIIDDGIGFEVIPDIQSIRHSEKDSHTHIGMKNLDKRLKLLYGSDSGIKITSLPNKCTTVSFHIPRNQFSHDI